MRIDLTIRSDRGDLDVAVIASEPVPLGAVRERLEQLAGLDRERALSCGGRPLPDSARIGRGELRSGALIEVGRAADHPSATATSLAVHVVCGPSAGTVVPLGRGVLEIGRDESCDVVLRDDRASRRHASLAVTSGSVDVRDHVSTNGTWADGARVGSTEEPSAQLPLAPDAVLQVGDSLLVVRGTELAPAARTTAAETVVVNRAPRAVGPPSAPEVVLPEPGGAARPRPIQWLGALLPAAAAGGLAWFTGSLVMLLIGVLSPVMLLSGALGERLNWQRYRRRRAASYRTLRAEADVQVATGLRVEAAARRAAAPDPVLLSHIATMPASRLWERRRSDPDFLGLRLGSARLPSELVRQEGSRRESAGMLDHVPLCVDLRAGPLGLAGPLQSVSGLARWLVAQLATLHSPADVELVLLLSGDAVGEWAWARWLPHLSGRVATCPDSWRSVVADLTRTTAVTRGPTGPQGSWTVLVLDRAVSVTDVPGLGALLDAGPRLGVTGICVDTDAQALPTACVSVARILGGAGTRLVLKRGSEAQAEALIDVVSTEWAEAVARSLAPLADAAGADASAVPQDCTLVEVLELGCLDVDSVSRSWASSTGRADTVLGIGADGPLQIDLAADGPHALVAGTTGAGKSQLLQTLVTGLALRHPPDEITFLLIDYKGGAAFADCARLPHAVGMVTDLDPHLTRRALRSLDAELRHRERLLATAGISDLDAYRALRRPEPIARLVLVVDEFATLADELPDFVRGIVAVAQRGRSLGVHLVLATQRPGRAVTPEIRANTSLRIALRVTDPGESADVVEAPDAASISRDRPGRAYLRSGDRYACFQTARVRGARSSTDAARVERLADWRRCIGDRGAEAEDELAGVVDIVAAAADRAGHRTARPPWCPPLPDLVTAGSLGREASPLRLPIGRLDLPAEQAQPVLHLDLTRPDSLLLVGAPRSGRTTALATIALAAATALGAADLELHVIDPTGGALLIVLGGLPQLGTGIGPGDASIITALLRRLTRDDDQPSGRAVLVLIDSWDRYVAGLDEVERAGAEDLLAGLLRTAAGSDTSVAVSGDRTLLVPRVAGAFDTRLLLRPTDRSDYALTGIAPADLPARMPPGRGIRMGDGAEVQLAHPGHRSGVDELHRVAAAVATRWRGSTGRTGVPRLRSLPDRVPLEGLGSCPDRLILGRGGHTAEPVSADLFAGARRLLVAGPARAGKTTTLLSLLRQGVGMGHHVLVAAPPRSPLVAAGRAASVPVLTPGGAAEPIVVPDGRLTLLLIDDGTAFADTEAGDLLAEIARCDRAQLAIVLAGRCDELAGSYRGVAAEVRSARCGILLRPGPIDGELLGIRLERRATGADPPGRGVLVGDPAWGSAFVDGLPIPIQIAVP